MLRVYIINRLEDQNIFKSDWIDAMFFVFLNCIVQTAVSYFTLSVEGKTEFAIVYWYISEFFNSVNGFYDLYGRNSKGKSSLPVKIKLTVLGVCYFGIGGCAIWGMIGTMATSQAFHCEDAILFISLVVVVIAFFDAVQCAVLRLLKS